VPGPVAPARSDDVEASRRPRRAIVALARLLSHVFFRSVEDVGRELIPGTGPTVLVANHTNGLVDPLLILAVSPRAPRFLAKSTLWKVVLLRPLLRMAAAVPVFRPRDGESTSGNDETFRVCRAVLARGGVVAVFPEGTSHDEPSLQPLKTGAARIALGASFDDGVAGVVVVPVALIYDAKARFRSRALVRVGEQIPVRSFSRQYQSDSRAAVTALTTDIEDRLRALGPDYESWQEATEFAEIAEILAGPSVGDAGPRPSLHTREELASRLSTVAIDTEHAAGLMALRDVHARYRHDLALLGVDDHHVTTGLSRRRPAWTAVGMLLRFAVWLIPVTVGVVGNWLPYRAIGRLARIPRTEGMRATFKLLGSIVLLPLWWLGFAGLAWAFVAWWLALVVVVLLPICGYEAIRGIERWRRFGGRIEARAIVAARHDVIGAVLADRGEIFEAALALPLGLGGDPGDPGDPGDSTPGSPNPRD
jgi:glycerol-3-phosphate O-acyltransferase / dihydroxyacetone phosphate acyltransferase